MQVVTGLVRDGIVDSRRPTERGLTATHVIIMTRASVTQSVDGKTMTAMTTSITLPARDLQVRPLLSAAICHDGF